MADDAKHRLILLRHAKSDWPEGVPDHDRPLAKRGLRDAPRVGRWLNRHGYLPGTVVCSTALRTRQTWDLAAVKLDASPRVRFERRAYAASAMTLLYLARELPATAEAGIALLIGHNPGISDLASSLVAGPVDGQGTHRGGISFPTAGVAVLEFDGDWADLAPGQARLAAFVTPADM